MNRAKGEGGTYDQDAQKGRRRELGRGALAWAPAASPIPAPVAVLAARSVGGRLRGFPGHEAGILEQPLFDDQDVAGAQHYI